MFMAAEVQQKNRGRIEIQPRFKIQYPMKNHNKDAVLIAERCKDLKKFIIVFLRCGQVKQSPSERSPDGLLMRTNIYLICSYTLLLLPILLFDPHQVVQPLPGWEHNATAHPQR